MAAGSRRKRRTVDVWPGYVDALSALLMLVIFVLLIFAFGQFLLSQVLSSQEDELGSLHRRVDELSQLLGLEQERNRQLGKQMEGMSDLVTQLTEEKFELAGQVQGLEQRLAEEQARLKQQLLVMASLQQDIEALRRLREELEGQVGALASTLGSRSAQNRVLRDRSKALEARLADQEEQTLLAQQQIEQRDIRLQALSALVGDQDQALQEERRLSAAASAEMALLNRKIAELQSQLEEIGQALAVSEADKQEQAAQLEDLGKRLNLALARQVNKLEQYRSEFFGRLRAVLGDDPNIRVVGDRFVLQSELLFASGSADLGDSGRQQLAKLAVTLREISARIPPEIDWILRIDGHTDRIPIHTERFASNWELSTARAVSVVRFLASQGIAERRMSAAGFGEFHPIDPRNTEDALRRNRRIELKLTSR
jgi:chemotaxis protein MotB